MSDAVEVAITRALLGRVAQFAAAQNPALTVSYPNTDFTPPAASKTTQWIRVGIFPADSIDLGLSYTDSVQRYGYLQVDVFQGQGIGEPAPKRLAESVVEYFARGTRMTLNGFNVDIWKTPRISPLLKDDPWVFIPVRAYYLCLANPA